MRALPAAPGTTSAAASGAPAVGSDQLDRFYDTVLRLFLNPDPACPLALMHDLPAGAADAAAAVAVARAVGLHVFEHDACHISAAGWSAWPPPGSDFQAQLAPGGGRCAREAAQALPPGATVWLCNFACGDRSMPWFRVPSVMRAGSVVGFNCGEVKLRNGAPAAPPPPHVLAARGALLARVLLARRARVLGGRVAGGALRGASLQHCQALAGEPRLCLTGTPGEEGEDGVDGFDVVHAQHTRDTQQLDTRRADVAALLTHGLLLRVPPPEVPPSADDDDDNDDADAFAHGEEDDGTQPRSSAARRRAALRLEVTPFVAAFVELLDCKLLATPVNAKGSTPLECVPAASAAAEAGASLFNDYRAPTSLLRVRLRRHEAAVALAADAAARVPQLWLAVTAALCVAAVAVATLAAWQACMLTAAALAPRLPAALAAPLPLRAVVAVATLASVRTMLLGLGGALLGSHSLSDAAAALHRATYLAAARACGWRVPLLRDAAALEARCAAQLRVWAHRALIADMRAAVRAKCIGARRALAIMAAAASAAPERCADAFEEFFPMPGAAAEVEAFLALPCDEDEGEDDGGAAAVGLSGVDDIIQGALQGGHSAAMPALLQEAPAYQPDAAQRNARVEAAAESRHAKRAKQKRRPRPAARVDAAAEGAVDDDGDGDTQDAPAAPETPAPAAAAPRARDRAGWRTVEAMLSDGGWRFVRRSGHVLFRRHVRLAGSGATKVQTFVAPCTPSDVRAGRNAAATLRRLDRELYP